MGSETCSASHFLQQASQYSSSASGQLSTHCDAVDQLSSESSPLEGVEGMVLLKAEADGQAGAPHRGRGLGGACGAPVQGGAQEVERIQLTQSHSSS